MLNKTFTRTFAILVLSMMSCLVVVAQTSADGVWTEIGDSQLRNTERQIVPASYRTFSLNRATIIPILDSAPAEFSEASRFMQTVLTLPMPDGTFQRFRIQHSPIAEPGLFKKIPELARTYNGQGIDDPTATVRLDLMPHGFHGMILSNKPTVYIDPYAKGDIDHYISYQKTSLSRDRGFYCAFDEENPDIFGIYDNASGRVSNPFGDSVINGSQLRTYRLAIAATNEYCAVFGGTLVGCQAAIVTSMNRVNGVYEKDVAIRMVIVANNNLIVYASDTTNCGGVACNTGNDPYTNSSGSAMLSQNQTAIDGAIGNANYDIGHVFSTGGGGVASLNSPCAAGSKARGVTGLPSPIGDGFDIDFVAHEMGHQYGGNHTFNTSCGGNRSAGAAYEPGSGITIMGYAGVCGAQDLAAHSIDTFHVRSLEEIVAFREGGGNCGPATATGNTPPAVSVVGGPTWNIPKLTPFTLTATGSDVNGDSITYDWQEYDLGPATSSIPNDDTDGQAKPIFRQYLPTTGPSRTFPTPTYILNNANVPPATDGSGFLLGERLPSITRTMLFQVVARDNRASGGGINTAIATLNVDGNSGPFAVTSPNTNVTWTGNSLRNITWNVANTAGAPVNTANVKISYSTDGGNTFPTTLLASTPNDGSQPVTIPVGNTTTARIKIEAVGNIFFDVSDVNFAVSGVAPPAKTRADFDGDGRTDLSVFRPSEGNWYLNRSTSGFAALNWGISTDILAPGDYDNDNKTDVAVFRPSDAGGVADFYILNSATSTVSFVYWGNVGDLQIVGDYDGDGKSDPAIFRPSTGVWWILRSTGGVTSAPFGAVGDIPISADFDGDGKNDIVVYRSSLNRFLGFASAGGSIDTNFGAAGDLLVPADYDGDGKDDYAVYRPSTGQWRIYNINTGMTDVTTWGISTDVPVPGDYDGDGRDDVAVYRNGTWYVLRSTSGALIQNFGVASDKPIPRQYIP